MKINTCECKLQLVGTLQRRPIVNVDVNSFWSFC